MKKVTWKEVTMTVVLGIIGFIMANVTCELWSSLYNYTTLEDMISYDIYLIIGYILLIGNFSAPFHVYFNIIK